jgi:hypothetical protein
LPKTRAAPDVGCIVTSGGGTHSSSSIAGGQRPLRLETGVRAEQPAFAEFDLNFVTERSLPEWVELSGPSLP